MKKNLLIICLLFLMCGCNKKEKEITSSNEITAKDNLTFEYAEKIKLYDLVNSDRGITDNNDYIDTYKLGNNEITINYTNSKNEEDKVKVTYNVVDSTKPIILLSSSITAYKGKDINLVNSGICADNYDKKPNCYVEGEYDINKVGKYDLKYVAVDSNNNKNPQSIFYGFGNFYYL